MTCAGDSEVEPRILKASESLQTGFDSDFGKELPPQNGKLLQRRSQEQEETPSQQEAGRKELAFFSQPRFSLRCPLMEEEQGRTPKPKAVWQVQAARLLS